MTFLKIQDSMTDDRKVKRLARELNIPYAQAVGTMALLWLSVQKHVPDGVLSDWDEIDIADYAQFPGEPAKLCHALLKWGLLDKTANGALQVHDWETHCGLKKTYKKREQARIRQERRRKRLKDEAAAAEASNAHVTRDSREVTPGEGEREREHIGGGFSPPPDALAAAVDQPRSALVTVIEEKQPLQDEQQQQRPRATSQVDLPARVQPAAPDGLRLDQVIALCIEQQVDPHLGHGQRNVLVKLCATTAVTRDEMMQAIAAAKRMRNPNIGLVVKKLEWVRSDAAVTRDAGGTSPKLNPRDAMIARGLMHYAAKHNGGAQ